MSTREKLYNMLENLSEEQLEGLFQFLSNFVSVNNLNKNSDTDELDELMGIFHDAADTSKIALEKTAWENAAFEKHLTILEENDENS